MSDPHRPGLRVSLVQRASSLDPAENRATLAGLATDADLVVLPEAFARDFGTPDDDLAAYAETTDGPFATAVADLARDCTVVAGMFEVAPDGSRPYNTLVVRGAVSAEYRKIHLYDSFGYRESDRLTAGPWLPTVIDVAGWRVGLMTCYDPRFPELARALVAEGAEVLLVPAAWVRGRTPDEHAVKVDHWQTLIRARAIENTAYVVAVGQAAPRYSGRSLVVNPWGTMLAAAGEAPEVLEVTLDAGVLTEARTSNPSLANRRPDAR